VAIETLPYESADHFRDAEAQAELLADAVAEGDAHYIAHAIGVIAKARGMTSIEKQTGMKRQALYRAFSEKGNPTLETLVKVLGALDLRLSIEPASVAKQRELADA
jgi:probable addiction module antidote protein